MVSSNFAAIVHIWAHKIIDSLRQSNHRNESLEDFVQENREKQHQEKEQYW